MRPPLLLILLLSAGLAGCDRSAGDDPTNATNPAPATPAATTPAPSITVRSSTRADGRPAAITFDSTRRDFGSIDETSEVATAFEFTNTGGSELVITDIKASCGCTTPRLDKRRYLPGERGRIEVGFDPTRPGPTQKFITVMANTSPPSTQLTIAADVAAFLMVEPRILQLGVIPYGTGRSGTITVSSVDENFVIDSVSASVPDVTARVVPAGQETAPGPKTIEVTVEPTAPWGGLYFGVDITVTGRPTPDAEPVTHTRNIRAGSKVFGKLSADPDMFRLAVRPGEPIVREIRLTRDDGKPFRILHTQVRIPGLPGATVTTTPESLDTWLITLNATAGPRPGRTPGVVVVTTDVPGEEVIELRSLGMIQPPK